ncbi:Stk1 family PASTA domain-containing Ser/Thr kinase [Nocardia terpenica]|uniref:Stk1 family PASTA domain-containing Ser/Thr kinase n=1 Tax=Nocardia terpenica TaxID=455432 RepID=UPI0015C551F3|nr:Stk1 family PASTA domain-containing Ser/Thr kinase [Nocardia terpenica]MBF6066030.1 Stk1 family PASTA domain-containing Ser/Thr kinase [Nocardia terpenica]MBF6109043.1 Stk1 family PASTA domain-containing Ser/Thr kinase [Nocardia terpenica]MBF6116274.1 Stk1 family PASTA domain-containing Ser/Thr kinase [Nocardia terpenica]MBF6123275.1 Stk1 family PASTA domain-containing Ser/Thr kinase [Nocardia terpenica]MBF6156542.1 Stk1 family PASTA domain-containing Ser/Thr kinase [Nocardia terpenica]
MTTPKNLSSRYELGEIIGFGGMSEVHKARDMRLGRDVAIKVLRADLARDPTFYLRFKREAQNAAALNHPAIVAVYDTGEAEVDGGPLPYIVMEYVDGDTLRDIVRGKGPLPPRRAMEVIADVCAALDFSHKNGIVHRDMKPANIMINRQGAVKVMDFGIARAIADSSNPMTQTAAVIGTAQYLSPEQARGEQVDARSDVYSVGCVLYEILTGEPPFTGDSPIAVAYQHVREDPNLPSHVHPGVPRELDSVVLKAMAKNPANRYQTAAEMRADLIRVLGGQKPQAPTVMTEEDRTTFLGAVDSPHRYRGEEMDDQEPPDSRGSRRGLLIGAGVVGAVALLFALFWVLIGPGSNSDQITIPDNLANKPVAQVQDQLQKAGFSVAIQQKPDSKVAINNVISTQPMGGSRAPRGSTVTVQVSSGPQAVPVPDLTKLTQQQADQKLTASDLRLDPNVQRDFSSPDDKDKVIRQSSPPGSKIDAGSPIAITLGKGPEQVRVPDVVGQQIDVARPNLEDSAGFKVVVQRVNSSSPPGQVLSTDPSGGSMADKGSTITVQVATSDQITAPDLRGLTASQAFDKLRASGWTGGMAQIIQSNRPTLDGSSVGKVLDQSPAPGSPLSKTGAVTIYVGVLLLGPP